jgi:hypothetical protein
MNPHIDRENLRDALIAIAIGSAIALILNGALPLLHLRPGGPASARSSSGAHTSPSAMIVAQFVSDLRSDRPRSLGGS